jgi:rod shape-determining protein MreD
MERVSAMAGGFLGAVVPFLCGVVGVIVANLPISFSGGFLPPPLLALMPIYFWGVVRPDVMPLVAVFTLGLAQDLLGGTPLGLWAVCFIIVRAFVDRERESFTALSGWGAIVGFAIVAFVAMFVSYFVAALYYWQLPPVQPMAAAFAITILFYIPVTALLGLIHRQFVGPLRTHP